MTNHQEPGLDFRNQHLEKNTWTEIMELFPDMNLEYLILRDNNLEPEQMIEFFKQLSSNPKLERLDFEGMSIGNNEQVLESLSQALISNHVLSELRLRRNQITKQGAVLIAQSLLLNHTLQELHLDENNIGLTGFQALVRALQYNQTLRVLMLASNNMRSISEAAQLLDHNKILWQLDLSDNFIGKSNDDMMIFSEALTNNQNLLFLDLSDNCIDDVGASNLASALIENQILWGLDLSYNPIGDIGCCALAAALKVNKTLQDLYLTDSYITDTGKEAIQDTLDHNLSEIDIYNHPDFAYVVKCRIDAFWSENLIDKAYDERAKNITEFFELLGTCEAREQNVREVLDCQLSKKYSELYDPALAGEIAEFLPPESGVALFASVFKRIKKNSN